MILTHTLSRTVCQYRAVLIKLSTVVLLSNKIVLVCEYRRKSYIAKTRFPGLHFCRRQYGSISNYFDVIVLKSAEFGRIVQNNGHYAVQGHSKSPIESHYATSY